MAATVVIVGLLSWALTLWLSRPNSPIRIIDRPNERSLHSMPTPRTGGIAICTALLSGWLLNLLAIDTHLLPPQIIIGAVVIAAVALIDDRFGLSPLVRLLVQLMAALILIHDGFVVDGTILPGFSFSGHWMVLAFLTVVMTLWLTNLYNFMDGMDGFAGGMAMIGFGTLAILGWLQGDPQFAGAALAVCAASAGFLWFNFPPARIFMGDTGSTTLGFLVAAFTIWGSRIQVAEAWVTLLIFSPFIVDATVTLVRRAIHGEPVWRAHRSHYYQRLVRIGWGHRRTVLAEYLVMLICALSAIAIGNRTHTSQWLILAVLFCGYASAAIVIHRLERQNNGINRN